MNLGNKIKNIRYRYNLSQEELADILNINRKYLSRIENNKSFPTSDILIKLAHSFNISIDSLLEISLDFSFEDRKDKIKKINKCCEEMDNNDLDLIINLLCVMLNKR